MIDMDAWMKNFFLNLKNGGTVDFHLMSEALFAWSRKWIVKGSESKCDRQS